MAIWHRLVAIILFCGSTSFFACGEGASDDDSGAGAPDGGGEAGPDALPASPEPKHLLWFGAHPDDETLVSPWLGFHCVERKIPCTFVVATRGEAGNCKLAPGCTPDLASVRAQELAKSVALFGGTLVHWDLGDGKAPDAKGVLEAWALVAGGPDALVQKVVDAIDAAGADRVITFDPRHGDTCHADHRAVGALVALATQQLGAKAPAVTLAASKKLLQAAVPSDPALITFDAGQVLPSTGKPAWSFVVEVMTVHASQFYPSQVATIASLPADQQKTWLLDLASVDPNDPEYQGLCD